MTDAVRTSVTAIITEIERNDFTRLATDPDDCEAYEIVRRIILRIDRARAGAVLAEAPKAD